jgi:GntR family transcriptional regulator
LFIDPKSTVPVYRQIVEAISRAIDAGVYRPGESLPAQRSLAATFRVNPNTVQRAIDELLRDGVVESRKGLGVFVVNRGRQRPHGASERQLAEILEEAVALGFDAGLTPFRIRELFDVAMRARLAMGK